MDQTHLHLLLNHFPILGSLFGFLLLGTGLVMKRALLGRAGLVTIILVSLVAVPVFLTGEVAEERVEDMAGVSERYIDKHEDMASTAFWFMIATGLLALLALIISLTGGRAATVLKSLTLVLAGITFALMAVTGNYGGKIRHSELRDNAPAVQENDNRAIELDDD